MVTRGKRRGATRKSGRGPVGTKQLYTYFQAAVAESTHQENLSLHKSAIVLSTWSRAQTSPVLNCFICFWIHQHSMPGSPCGPRLAGSSSSGGLFPVLLLGNIWTPWTLVWKGNLEREKLKIKTIYSLQNFPFVCGRNGRLYHIILNTMGIPLTLKSI